MKKTKKQHRDELIAVYKEKPVEWLAEKLAEKKLDCDMLEEKTRMHGYNYSRKNAITSAVEKENEILKDILEMNGIRPTKVRLEYVVSDCDNCDFNNDEDENWDCYYMRNDGECPIKKCVFTGSFYAYKIDDGFMSGITNDFKKEYYDLLRAVDDRTGQILYECKGGKK